MFVKTQEEYPKNKNDEVYVNMRLFCRFSALNLYSPFDMQNYPHESKPPPESARSSTIDIIINGNTYTVETLFTFGQGTPPSDPKFQIIINTIDSFL